MNSTKTQNILIIGAGELGTALTHVLKKKRAVRIEQWDKDPARVKKQRQLATAVSAADLVLLCIPSSAMREALIHIRAHLTRGALAVSFAKGIAPGTRSTMDELLRKHLPKRQPFALVSGPMIAEELMKGHRGSGMCAATPPRAYRRLADLFRDTVLALTYTPHLHALALAGVLKNVYALALGAADGLRWDKARKGQLTAASLKEMGGILALLGRGKALAASPAGAGDLIVTGYSKYSRNRRAGALLARQGTIDRGAEGIVALPSVISLLGRRARRYSILSALQRAMMHPKSAGTIFKTLVPAETLPHRHK